MREVIYINGKNAYTEWGVMPDGENIDALLLPAAAKEHIENDSRLQNGVEIIQSTKVAARDVQIVINIKAPNLQVFAERLQSFTEELTKGTVVLATSSLPGTAFRLTYESCSRLTQYNGRLGKFYVKFREADPTNRTAEV